MALGITCALVVGHHGCCWWTCGWCVRQGCQRSTPCRQAQVLFDRFHLVQHLNRAVDEVRRAQMRRLSRKQKVRFSRRALSAAEERSWNLTVDQKERLSTLVKWNTPITRAYYLKESFQLFFEATSSRSGRCAPAQGPPKRWTTFGHSKSSLKAHALPRKNHSGSFSNGTCELIGVNQDSLGKQTTALTRVPQ